MINISFFNRTLAEFSIQLKNIIIARALRVQNPSSLASPLTMYCFLAVMMTLSACIFIVIEEAIHYLKHELHYVRTLMDETLGPGSSIIRVSPIS